MTNILGFIFAEMQDIDMEAGAGSMFLDLIYIAVGILMVIALWQIFTKAGQHGILSIIPIVNQYFLCKICGYGVGIFILSLIPLINIIIGIMLSIKLAEKFGKTAWFGIGILFLPYIFLPILAFSDAEYQSA